MFLLQLFRSDVTRVMLLPAHLWCAPTTLNMITRSKSAARVSVAKRVGRELQASFIGIDSVVLVQFFFLPTFRLRFSSSGYSIYCGQTEWIPPEDYGLRCGACACNPSFSLSDSVSWPLACIFWLRTCDVFELLRPTDKPLLRCQMRKGSILAFS